MSIRPGLLDTPIDLQIATESQSDDGSISETWASISESPTWAQIVPLSASRTAESFAKYTTIYTTLLTIRIRRHVGLNAKNRLIMDGENFDILTITDYKWQDEMVLLIGSVS